MPDPFKKARGLIACLVPPSRSGFAGGERNCPFVEAAECSEDYTANVVSEPSAGFQPDSGRDGKEGEVTQDDTRASRSHVTQRRATGSRQIYSMPRKQAPEIMRQNRYSDPGARSIDDQAEIRALLARRHVIVFSIDHAKRPLASRERRAPVGRRVILFLRTDLTGRVVGHVVIDNKRAFLLHLRRRSQFELIVGVDHAKRPLSFHGIRALIRRLLKGVLRRHLRHLRARLQRAEEQCGSHEQYSAG